MISTPSIFSRITVVIPAVRLCTLDDFNNNYEDDSLSRGRVGVGIETDRAGDDNDNGNGGKAVVSEHVDCKSSITGSGGKALGGI